MRRRLAPLAFVLLSACSEEGASRSEPGKAEKADRAAPAASARPKAVAGGGAAATAAPRRPSIDADSADGQSAGGGKRRVRLAIVGGLGGSLTQAQIESTIEAAREALHACYGDVEVRLEVAVQIGATGEVAEAAILRSEPSAPKQTECAKLELEKLKFPPPRSSVKLDLQIHLDPQG